MPATTTLITYPSLLRRVQATFVDLLLPLFLFCMLAGFWPAIGAASMRLKLLMVAVLFSYEPMACAYGQSIGQRLCSIRVRRYAEPHRPLSLLDAYIRFAVKLLLGWLAYLTLLTNRERRALHDLVVGSIVLPAQPHNQAAAL